MQYEVEFHAHGALPARHSLPAEEAGVAVKSALEHLANAGEHRLDSVFGALVWPLDDTGQRTQAMPASFELRKEGDAFVLASGPRTLRVVPRAELAAAGGPEHEPEESLEMSE